ncbi:hypothetical protein JOD20_005432, partial [Herpetosiphon giganteus]|nr:hypothetical protein [Herpetosiphon giganteus]
VLLWVWFRHHPVYQTEVVLYPLVERPCPPLNVRGRGAFWMAVLSMMVGSPIVLPLARVQWERGLGGEGMNGSHHILRFLRAAKQRSMLAKEPNFCARNENDQHSL